CNLIQPGTPIPGFIVSLRHARLVRASPPALWQGARRALWGGAPRSAQPPEPAYSGGGAIIR
ncbi:MAG: hypothetical protein J6Z47_08100, partial [Bacteroidales bacterium]|nr:hypothetical protein [Bacteroidales bacterium]